MRKTRILSLIVAVAMILGTMGTVAFAEEQTSETKQVATKAELDEAIIAAKEGDTIRLTADIDYGSAQLKIEKAIILDLGGNTLTTANNWGGMSLKNNPTIKNGTVKHTGNTAAIKAWNVTAFEDLTVEVSVYTEGKTKGGIVIQEGSTVKVGTIKNVTINGAGLTNGIETYNCGNATEPVIGSMENVTIDAVGTGMLISAPCGTATNCSISGGITGIELWIKGTYSASLDLANCDVEGGEKALFVHDEFTSASGVVNNGVLKLTADADSTFTSEKGVAVAYEITRAENVELSENIIELLPAASKVPVEVTTYEELVAALNKDNANVIMMNDITASAKLQNGYKDGATGIILESGDVLDGNGKTLTINDANGTYGAVIAMKGGEVKNLTIAGAFRGVFMPGANGDVVIDNCIFKDVIYTFNSDAGSKDYTVTIKNSALNGWTSFSNVHKSVTFENCTFGKGCGYAFLRPYQPTEFNGCDFGEDYELDASQTTANSLVFNSCTYNGAPLSASNGWGMFYNGGDVLVDGEAVHFIASDKVVASVGDTIYDNLKDAIAAADGKTVTLLTDVALTETITVPAGKTVTLDLNGKTITGTDKAASGNFALITNKGTLTVDDSVGTGAITLTAENDRSWNALSAVISNEGGTLIVKNGKIEHLGGSAMAYGIDNNSTLGETKVVVKGGTIASPYRGIRAFQNSKTKMNSIVMEGGKIVAKAGIWMHQSGADSLGEVTVTGGKIEAASNAIVTDIHSGAKTTITIKGGEFSNTSEAANLLLVWPFSNMSTVTEANETVMNIEGGSFDCAGEGNLIGVLNGADANTDVAVSGGIFSEAIAEEYIAEGFKLVSNSDGTYGVKEDTPWTTATDAGFYKENGVVKGLMRYLFHFGGVGTITDAGVKFIKGSDLAAKVQAGEIAKGEASNTFFADINEIPENTTGRYYAMGFVTIGEKTYWSNPIFCEPNFTRYFKSLDIPDNGGNE